MVKCLPEFEYFTVFLKNKNIIFKIRRSKITDDAALNVRFYFMDYHFTFSKKGEKSEVTVLIIFQEGQI